jgi:pSer/pThr/pTyr-binding forkhead associated (FHA) protein
MSQAVHGELVPLAGGDPIPLVRDVLTIGRRESCDIPLRFANVSSVHCRLMYQDGYWFIRDEGSTNGVKVNGVRVQRKLLIPGSEITIAKRKWKIMYELQAGRQAMQDMEDDDEVDVLRTSLLERAGLAKAKPTNDEIPDRKFENFDPGEFLLDDDG